MDEEYQKLRDGLEKLIADGERKNEAAIRRLEGILVAALRSHTASPKLVVAAARLLLEEVKQVAAAEGN